MEHHQRAGASSPDRSHLTVRTPGPMSTRVLRRLLPLPTVMRRHVHTGTKSLLLQPDDTPFFSTTAPNAAGSRQSAQPQATARHNHGSTKGEHIVSGLTGGGERRRRHTDSQAASEPVAVAAVTVSGRSRRGCRCVPGAPPHVMRSSSRRNLGVSCDDQVHESRSASKSAALVKRPAPAANIWSASRKAWSVSSLGASGLEDSRTPQVLVISLPNAQACARPSSDLTTPSVPDDVLIQILPSPRMRQNALVMTWR